MSRHGTFVTTMPSMRFALDKLVSLVTGPRCALAMVKPRPQDLRTLGTWMADGMTVPIDSAIALAEVPVGLDRLERGLVHGRVVVGMHCGSPT